MQDEMSALQTCQKKVREKKLPMEVIDAEYQWCVCVPFQRSTSCLITYRDRRKLTFYFIAEKRIDFRELVRELFRCVVVSLPILNNLLMSRPRLYKTRIWMASLQGPGGYEQ